MELALGPIDICFYSGSNWSSFKLGFVTNRDGGAARRESAIRGSFKSEHLIEAVGTENTADVAIINGKTYHGRIVRGLDGDHVLSALQVAARHEYQDTLRQQKRNAVKAAADVEASNHADGPQPTANGNGGAPAAEPVAA